MLKLRIKRPINSYFTPFLQQNANLPQWKRVLLAFLCIIGILLQMVIAWALILCEYNSLLILPFFTILTSLIPSRAFSIFVQFWSIIGYIYFGTSFLSYGLHGLEWDDKEEGKVIYLLVLGVLMLCAIPLIFIQLVMTYREYNKRHIYEAMQLTK